MFIFTPTFFILINFLKKLIIALLDIMELWIPRFIMSIPQITKYTITDTAINKNIELSIFLITSTISKENRLTLYLKRTATTHVTANMIAVITI